MIDNKMLMEKALGIHSPWYIKDVSFDAEAKRLDIYIDFEKGARFEYEDLKEGIKGDFPVHDTVEKQWRHLNFFQHECYLHARIPRIDAGEGRIRIITPPWAGLSNGFTMLFEALVLQLASSMPVHTAAAIIGESDYKIWNILERYVDQALEQVDLSRMTAVGMDETAMRRGHDYITLFVDMNGRRTVHVAEGRGSETVREFATALAGHGGDPGAITDVSCDMSPAFIKGVSETLPNAQVTFDKFHLLKVINEAVDQVRREETFTEPLLRNSRYALLKNASNLTSAQREKLEELSLPKFRLKSIRALHIRENFQEIYKARTAKQFAILLQKWYFWATHSRLEPVKKAAQTIKRHWDGVLRWKQSQISNGILEGLNSLVQAAKAKARGFKTFRHFRIIVFLLTGKLDFSLVGR